MSTAISDHSASPAWTIHEDVWGYPAPAAGRLVFASRPASVLPGVLESRRSGLLWGLLVPTVRRQVSLVWRDKDRQDRIAPLIRRHLIHAAPAYCPWLPPGWCFGTVPTGWTSAHVLAWVEWAADHESTAQGNAYAATDALACLYRPDTARILLRHACLALRAADLRGLVPPEPTCMMDDVGALAALEALGDALRSPGETAQRGMPRKGAVPSDEQKPDSGEQYVTLDQAAALVNKSKRTLEYHLRARQTEEPEADMPLPDVEGGGGRSHEWKWSRLRPWLERTFRRQLPERIPDRLR
jgi:hypothetical protein